eukprot:3156738-Amphidinium_carterae.1
MVGWVRPSSSGADSCEAPGSWRAKTIHNNKLRLCSDCIRVKFCWSGTGTFEMPSPKNHVLGWQTQRLDMPSDWNSLEQR